MATFTNPLTFPHLFLYLSKYSFKDMVKVYKAAFNKSLIWSDIPLEFVKMSAIPDKILKSEQSSLSDYHESLPVLLERSKCRILELQNEQPSKIEYDIFSTWTALQNAEVKGLFLVSEMYSPVFVLVSFIPLNYSLVSGDTLSLSTITIDINTNDSFVNQIDLGKGIISFSELTKQPIIDPMKVSMEIKIPKDIDVDKLKEKLLNHLKNNQFPVLDAKVYSPKNYNDTDSASIPVLKKKKEKVFKRKISL